MGRPLVITRDTPRVTLALILSITIVCGLPVFLLAALFTEVAADLAAPRSALGVIIAVYWVMGAIISVLAGGVTVRIGARKVLVLSLRAAMLSLTGMAAATPSWQWFLVWAAVGGVAAGASQPGMNQLLTRRISVARRPLAFGLKQSAVPLSTMLCGLAIPAIALTVGWRWAFAAAGLLAALALIAFVQLGPMRLARGTPRSATSLPLGPGQGLFFLTLAGVTLFGVAAVNIVVSYGVVSAVERGIDLGTAGLLLGASSAAGAGVRILVGALVGRFGGSALRITAAMQAVGVIGILTMVPVETATYAIGLTIAFAIGWGWPGLIHLSVATIAGPSTPSATGIVQTGSYIGSAGGPLAAGLVYTVWGDQAVWWVSAVMLALSATLALLVAARPRPPQPSFAADPVS